MSSDTHYRVAVELGFSEELVKRALKKCKFKTAGDFVDYLQLNEEELMQDEQIDEEEKVAPAKQLEKVAAVKEASAKVEKSLREETEDLYHRSICLSCFSRKRCIVTLPCSHFTLCDLCLKRTKKCPQRDCGEEIEHSIYTYF